MVYTLSFYASFSKRRYINFVKYISKNVEDIEKFKNSFINFSNKKIVDSFLEDTINSKNEFSSIIFSKLLINIIENNKIVSHEDIACSEIIRSFNDYDMKNFIYLYETSYAQDYPNKKNEVLNDGYDIKSVAFTGEKLKTLFLHDTANYFAFKNGGIAFNETAATLYNFLMEINIKELIKKINV